MLHVEAMIPSSSPRFYKSAAGAAFQVFREPDRVQGQGLHDTSDTANLQDAGFTQLLSMVDVFEQVDDLIIL